LCFFFIIILLQLPCWLVYILYFMLIRFEGDTHTFCVCVYVFECVCVCKVAIVFEVCVYFSVCNTLVAHVVLI